MPPEGLASWLPSAGVIFRFLASAAACALADAEAWALDWAGETVGWVPLYHDMGLVMQVMEPLYVGAHSVLMPPASLMQRPLSWLGAISAYRAEVTCAPNFAFLMVADAYDAVSAIPGVRSTEVVLEDHFASDAINGGVAAQAGFAASFDGEAVAELHGLRADFLRKAVMAGTDQVCRPLLAAGASRASLLAMTLGKVPASGALDRLHVTIAPLLIGSGIPAFTLPETATLTNVLRFDWSVHRLGCDLLVDIPLSRARPPA